MDRPAVQGSKGDTGESILGAAILFRSVAESFRFALGGITN